MKGKCINFMVFYSSERVSHQEEIDMKSAVTARDSIILDGRILLIRLYANANSKPTRRHLEDRHGS